MGDLYYYQGKRLLQQVKPEQAEKNLDKLSTALQYARKAQAYEGNNSRYLELEAGIVTLQATAATEANMADRAALLQEAKGLYLQSLQQQPSWAYAWLGLVENKILQQQYDSQLSHAIERSLSLGGHEALVQWQLLKLSLGVFQQLDSATKKRVLHSYDQALQGGAYIGQYIRLGEAHGFFALFCHKPDLSGYATAVQKRCQALLPNSQ
jgi:hypothetical protein